MSIKIINPNIKFGTLKYTNKPNKIVLHHAAHPNCSVYDVHKWHLNNGWSGIGYHYFVRKDGTIYRGRPESVQGSHCPNANTTSIGICAEGHFGKESMGSKQKSAIIELIKDIQKRKGITAIYGHKELSATSCPDKNYPLAELKKVRPTTTTTGGSYMSKTYKNGSTAEIVYADSSLTMKIGCLNPWESCEAIADTNGKIVVLYNTSSGKKTGFVKYRGGL